MGSRKAIFTAAAETMRDVRRAPVGSKLEHDYDAFRIRIGAQWLADLRRPDNSPDRFAMSPVEPAGCFASRPSRSMLSPGSSAGGALASGSFQASDSASGFRFGERWRSCRSGPAVANPRPA